MVEIEIIMIIKVFFIVGFQIGNMKVAKYARTILIILSICIFCYQMLNALDKLANQPLVDSTRLLPITKLSPSPVISLCTDNPPDEKILEQLGYGGMDSFLIGKLWIGK